MREQTRPEFEAYEKTVETALFNLQRSAGPEDRSGFEEVSSLAREIVDLRRQMLEMKERGFDEQDGRNAAGDVSRESGAAPERTASEVQEQTNANLQWEAAVAKHGEAVVEAGNDAMANVEHYRSGLAHIEGGELGDENREQYEKGLEASLHHAAQLAATGNGYLRDVANEDPELRAEFETIERNEERGDETKSNKQPITADTADDRQRDLTNHVTLEFGDGSTLPDPHGVLVGKGKHRRHIRIDSEHDLEAKKVGDYINAARARSDAV